MSAERNCPRKTLKSIRKTVWKTRKRIWKTIRNATEEVLAPLRPLKNISPALFSTNFKSFSPPKICTKRKVFFSPRGSAGVATLPSDTKLLLAKNYSEIIIFEKLRISCVIPWKNPSFPEISRVQNPSRITKNNSQGIIFVIISCQRV